MKKRSDGREQNPAKNNNDQPDKAKCPETPTQIGRDYTKVIQAYFGYRQKRLEIVDTTVTQGGQTLDWIPLESQTPDGRIASPPPEVVGVEQEDSERPVKPITFELETQKEARGPKGCVPISRRTITSLRRGVTMKDYLSKHGRPTYRLSTPEGAEYQVPATSAAKHWYARSSQSVTCYGGAGRISAWNPYVEWSDEFSLGQIALSRGSGNGLQTVEAGWQVYRQLYGDWNAHLFIFYTTNGYTNQGDNLGGYNQDVDGWVQYSNIIYPTALSSPVSTLGGAQYIMAIKYQLWEGNWWLMVNGSWIGYYPANLFGNSGLLSQANSIYWYGEVVDSDTRSGMTETDMGSGHWPYEGWTWCAYMNNLQYQSSPQGAMQRYNGTVWKNDRECYDIEQHFNNTGSWQSYMWFGGSGRNSKCQ